MTNPSLRTSSTFAGLIFAAAISLSFAQAQTAPAQTTPAQTPSSPPPAAPAANPAPPAGNSPPAAESDKAAPATNATKREDRIDERRNRAERRQERVEARRRATEWRRAMGPFALAPLCSPRLGEAVDFYLEGIDEIVQPTNAQRPKYDDLKQAASKAREEAANGCNAEVPITPTGRLEVIQARLDAVLRAVRTLRPALDAFYESLSDEQKAHFNQMVGEPRRRGRLDRWRDRWLRR
ncbi:MAG: Spy/CpxP family protein refolding chaperone [Rhizobiales bacterium]|nr:Spy/CpxP family protein refolding chaperone [Hyphomicrobiales bacterium]